jgi:hypothetical protein
LEANNDVLRKWVKLTTLTIKPAKECNPENILVTRALILNLTRINLDKLINILYSTVVVFKTFILSWKIAFRAEATKLLMEYTEASSLADKILRE